MPNLSERQILTDELLLLFVGQLLIEDEEAFQLLIDTESDDSESDSDPDNYMLPKLSDDYLTMLQQLHATCYLNTRIYIPKTAQQLILTLTTYKNIRPELF
jgi:hypothetical protein